ncbi:MAG TPA: ABC transporter substrate-binding protein, partial [Candidatus Polarisedimenticolaceae bacterium]|nr:ABC transporter substrate-binding protein [Candidatus Polarisedimenticolaceae bacterium]
MPRTARFTDGVRGALVLGAVLAGGTRCGRAPATPLVAALQADLDSWNPYTARDATTAGVLDLLYPRLAIETGLADEAAAFRPWLASAWEFSPDRLRLTFHLRPAARWSDGTPVTCADVQFTYRAQLAEPLAWPGAFVKRRIRAVDCPDAHTAVFVFTEATPDALADANDDAIVPARYGDVPFAAWGSTRWEERAITCGPFRLAQVSAGQEAVLVRDPAWWGAPAPTLERVVLRVYPDATIAFQRWVEGELDLLPKVPPLQAAQRREQAGPLLVELPSLSYTFLSWNVLRPGAYAADRQRRGCAAGRCAEDEADIRRL